MTVHPTKEYMIFKTRHIEDMRRAAQQRLVSAPAMTLMQRIRLNIAHIIKRVKGEQGMVLIPDAAPVPRRYATLLASDAANVQDDSFEPCLEDILDLSELEEAESAELMPV